LRCSQSQPGCFSPPRDTTPLQPLRISILNVFAQSASQALVYLDGLRHLPVPVVIGCVGELASRSRYRELWALDSHTVHLSLRRF
jgi:hypothetical protein